MVLLSIIQQEPLAAGHFGHFLLNDFEGDLADGLRAVYPANVDPAAEVQLVAGGVQLLVGQGHVQRGLGVLGAGVVV
jgi:hypothetical protein